MEEVNATGKARAIGVSNFAPDRLLDLTLNNKIVPAVNQVETHPFRNQKVAQDLMLELGVQIESWAPFAEGKNDLFSNALLAKIAANHGKTIGQVVLRWLTQREIVVIPKSVRIERMRENFESQDFTLSDAEMAEIITLDTGESQFFDHKDPDWVKRLSSRRL